MEELKAYEELTEPDERHALIAQITGVKWEMKHLYAEVASIEMIPEVPESIRSQFNVARNLALYTWFSYSFHPVAELKSYTLIEHALREKIGRDDMNFKGNYSHPIT